MRSWPIVSLLFVMMGCASGSQSTNSDDSKAQGQDVENKELPRGAEASSTVRKTETYGNVVRFEVVEDDTYDRRIRTLVSGKATAENQDFLNGLRDSALKTFPNGEWLIVGPEGSLRTIRLVCEKREIELSSWHPLGGGGGSVVAREKFDEIEQRLISRFVGP